MPALLLFFKHLELALRLHAAVPTLEFETAYDHAGAALAAATDRVEPELLLAIAFIESRYDVTATSRVVGSRRMTGSYPSLEPPRGLDTRASLYCGPLQTFASSWDECIATRDLDTAYATGARELEKWLRDRRVRGDVRRALAGHGCGNYGVTTGKCNAYPTRVLWVERKLAPPAPSPTLQARRAS